MPENSEGAFNEVLDCLPRWQQGDVAIPAMGVPVPWIFSRRCPLKEASKEIENDREDFILPDETFEAGFGVTTGVVVISQTCDLRRDPSQRPHVQFAPLAEPPANEDPDDFLRQVKGRMRPRYAFIPGLADRKLVADLEMVFTAEKGVLAILDGIRGCPTLRDQMAFRSAICRYFDRPALPDTVSRSLDPLRKWFKRKVGKAEPHRNADLHISKYILALDSILIRANPSWDPPTGTGIEIDFILLKSGHDDGLTAKGWEAFKALCQEKVVLSTPYVVVGWEVVELDSMSLADAREYETLDLDHLSDLRES